MSFRNQDTLSITGAKVGLSAIPTKRFADFFQKSLEKVCFTAIAGGRTRGAGSQKVLKKP